MTKITGAARSVALAGFLIASISPALADTGISGVDSARPLIFGVLAGFCGLLCLIAIVMACIDYFGHKNTGKGIVEFGVAIVFGLIGANLQLIADKVGIKAAMLLMLLFP